MTTFNLEFIAVGSELLTCARVDTNSAWLAGRLAALGLGFSRKTLVGDDPALLRAACQEVAERADVVICTGGLGPTFDDITKEVWTDLLQDRLREDEQVLADMQAIFARLQRPMPENNLKQALVPARATAIRNLWGTAPGIHWRLEGQRGVQHIFLLPGVPREMEGMWHSHVEPVLKTLVEKPWHTLRCLAAGVGESALDERLTPVRARHGNLEWTILSHTGQVEMLGHGPDALALAAAEKDMVDALGKDLVCVGEGTLPSTLLALLRASGHTLALCESVTGGRIAAQLTEIPGASEVLLGGVVAYSPQAKLALGGLPEATLAQHGTTSMATTAALAQAIRQRLGTTWALAVTGNAGPTTDPHGQAPCGTIHMAVEGPRGAATQTLTFSGERPVVQARAAVYALDFLRRQVG